MDLEKKREKKRILGPFFARLSLLLHAATATTATAAFAEVIDNVYVTTQVEIHGQL